MLEKFKTWCGSNTAVAKTTRTIFQGLIGVFVANLDIILGCFTIDPAMKPIIAAAVMAIIAPIQAQLGSAENATDSE